MTFAQQMALRKAAAAPARGGAVPARGGAVPARGGAVPARGGAVRGGAGSSSAGSDGAYSPSSPFLNTPQALAAATIRCGIDIVCERRTSPPTNANAVCLSGRCTFRCEQGYAPGGPQGTECVQGSNSCGGNTCATVENGYSTCAGTTCSYGCSTGYSLYNSGNSVVCLNLQSDPDNCGAQGNVCPTSCKSSRIHRPSPVPFLTGLPRSQTTASVPAPALSASAALPAPSAATSAAPSPVASSTATAPSHDHGHSLNEVDLPTIIRFNPPVSHSLPFVRSLYVAP